MKQRWIHEVGYEKLIGRQTEKLFPVRRLLWRDSMSKNARKHLLHKA
jgi:hypothetical protein